MLGDNSGEDAKRFVLELLVHLSRADVGASVSRVFLKPESGAVQVEDVTGEHQIQPFGFAATSFGGEPRDEPAVGFGRGVAGKVRDRPTFGILDGIGVLFFEVQVRYDDKHSSDT